jgi:hypothetical protein
VGRAAQEIFELVAPGESFILADADELGCPRDTAGRKMIPFIEQEGEYWGAPDDDAHALAELRRHKSQGAKYMVLAWPAFSWLDAYAEFAQYLRANYPCVIRNERLMAFDLRRA